MKHSKRFLAILLAVCALVTVMAGTATAATPSSMTVGALASASKSIATTLASGIPNTLTVGSYTMGSEDYILMAAKAICSINKGNTSDSIAYSDITMPKTVDSTGSPSTSISSSEYIDLADRISIYGDSQATLATSYKLEKTAYNGRITLYSISHMFAQVLSYYSSNGKLPGTVTFVAGSFTPGTFNPPTPPAEEDTWYKWVTASGKDVADYIDSKKALPGSVKLGEATIDMAQFQYLAARTIVGINAGTLNEILSITPIKAAANPTDTVQAGNLTKAQYVDVAQRCANWINNNSSTCPNYCSSPLGNIPYEEVCHVFANVLRSYKQNGTLPATTPVKSWATVTGGGTASGGSATFGNDFSAYSAYLVKTGNCQASNATIISVAKTAMNYNGAPSSTYQAMQKMVKYLNDKTSYTSPMYYNTRKGALKTWTSKNGNCCDLAHLVVGCARALGVPARYWHGRCRFSSGNIYGHVFAQIYCGSAYGWKDADIVSSGAYLGHRTNTTVSTNGTYATLPF